MIVRQILVAGTLVGMVAAPAHAQKFEASITGGYTFSEGVEASQTRIINGQIFDSLDITSGGSWGLTAGFFITPQAEVEFLFNRQFSTFEAGGSTSVALADMNIDNYHFNFVYNLARSYSGITPFIFGGLGMTHYSPGELQNLPVAVPGITDINSETRFSSTWGAGVKLYPAPKFGIRVAARWTPTYIKSDDAGLWCDPWYGVCWVVADADYSNQFHIDGGVTFRF